MTDNIEQKMFLADWMGFKIHHRNTAHLVFNYDKYPQFGSFTYYDDWDPFNNHKDFAEIYGNLTPQNVEDIIRKVTGGYGESMYAECFIDELMLHLPTVCQATYEILKGE